jgi:hypothetical protein
MSLFVILVVALIVVIAAYLLGVATRPGARPFSSLPRRRLAQSTILPEVPAPVAKSREAQALVGWLFSQAFEQTGIKVADDKVARQRIVEAAEKAVQELAASDSVSISLPYLTADTAGPKHFEVRVTRDTLRELSRY